MHPVNGTAPSPGRPTPGVVKQDKSSGGSVDTTKTRSDPQRVRMSSGERPIGAARGKQSDPKALCQPPPPPQCHGLRPSQEPCPPPPGPLPTPLAFLASCPARHAYPRAVCTVPRDRSGGGGPAPWPPDSAPPQCPSLCRILRGRLTPLPEKKVCDGVPLTGPRTPVPHPNPPTALSPVQCTWYGMGRWHKGQAFCGDGGWVSGGGTGTPPPLSSPPPLVQPPLGGGGVTRPINNQKSMGRTLVGYTRLQVTVVWCQSPPQGGGGGIVPWGGGGHGGGGG